MNTRHSKLKNAQKLAKNQLKTIQGGAGDCYLCASKRPILINGVYRIDVRPITAAEIPSCNSYPKYHVISCGVPV